MPSKDYVVAVLEVMWDWRAMTSSAGYAETAPPYFSINPDNFTGKRLYDWIGHNSLLVTNACPQLVSSASEKGTPDAKWLRNNLETIQSRFGTPSLVIVCGSVARQTYRPNWIPASTRIIEVPHPAARLWNGSFLRRVKTEVQEGSRSVRITIQRDEISFQEIPRAEADSKVRPASLYE